MEEHYHCDICGKPHQELFLCLACSKKFCSECGLIVEYLTLYEKIRQGLCHKHYNRLMLELPGIIKSWGSG